MIEVTKTCCPADEINSFKLCAKLRRLETMLQRVKNLARTIFSFLYSVWYVYSFAQAHRHEHYIVSCLNAYREPLAKIDCFSEFQHSVLNCSMQNNKSTKYSTSVPASPSILIKELYIYIYIIDHNFPLMVEGYQKTLHKLRFVYKRFPYVPKRKEKLATVQPSPIIIG